MSCYLCGCDDTITRQEGVRDNPEINVLECANCGLVYLSHLVLDSTKHRSESDIEAWAKATLDDDKRRAKDLRDLTYGVRLLDFGCGNGNFLQYATAGSKHGLEIDDDAREYCKASGLDAIKTLDEILGYFDIVTMFHVIEHLPDPTRTLTDIRRRLRNGGKLIIETPNSDDALLSLYKCKEFAEFTYWSKHPFLYNESTLTALAHQSGFKVTDMKQYQRYPLANHLYWLSNGKPGGHGKWPFLNDSEYALNLAKVKKCDTIIATLEKAC